MPRLVGNSGSAGSPAALGEPGAQDRRGWPGERGGPLLPALAVAADVRRRLPRWTSLTARPVSSETRSPVWTATVSSAWSRRPVHGRRSGAASRASISARSRKARSVRSKRLGGMASTRAMSGGVLGVAQRPRSRTASGSRPAGRCGSGRCCPARVRGGPGTRRSAGASRSAKSSCGRGLAAAVAGRMPSSSRQRVAVGGDGVPAGAALADQPVGEERLAGSGRAAVTAAAPCRWPSSRSAASASSSGQAVRYQNVLDGRTCPLRRLPPAGPRSPACPSGRTGALRACTVSGIRRTAGLCALPWCFRC